jgi:hypothetical protein
VKRAVPRSSRYRSASPRGPPASAGRTARCARTPARPRGDVSRARPPVPAVVPRATCKPASRPSSRRCCASAVPCPNHAIPMGRPALHPAPALCRSTTALAGSPRDASWPGSQVPRNKEPVPVASGRRGSATPRRTGERSFR